MLPRFPPGVTQAFLLCQLQAPCGCEYDKDARNSSCMEFPLAEPVLGRQSWAAL